MVVNPVAENVLGTMGTTLWTIQLLPQIWKSWRAKSTSGLSHWLLLLWGIASLPMGLYTLLQNLSIPLIVQPQAFGFLSLIAWSQCIYYDKGFSRLKAAFLAGCVIAPVGGLQVGIYFALRSSMNEIAVKFFGVLSSVIVGAGLLPQYWEIYQRKEVVGISLPFIAGDLIGGVFLFLSLIFRPKFDAFAGAAYGVVVVMDGVILAAAAILNPLAKRRRTRDADPESLQTHLPVPKSRTMTLTSTMNSSATSIAVEQKPIESSLE